MQRKWTVLAVAMASCIALAAGLSLADEDSELHKIMEQVNAKNATITKGVRTQVNFAKAQENVVKSAEDLVKLAKKAKAYQDAVKKAKDVPNAGEKWNQMMDKLIKTSKNLAEVAKKNGTTPTQTKKNWEESKTAHTAVKKSCAECHNVFRIEEE